MKTCTVIGISDRRQQWFPPEVERVIVRGSVFSGGKRHHEIMAPWLPAHAEWIDITIPLKEVFSRYEQHDDLVVFASGDPLFYGFASTLRREFPDCQLRVYPTFHSLQMLAHRLCLPYQDMHVVSLTGRPWDKLDEALIRGEALIGCLTDRQKTPHALWQRMQEYGYTNYQMTVGENLGNETAERVGPYDPLREYAQPNCLLLQRTSLRPRPFGIPEQDFHLLDGRTNMITKMPIRLLSLSMLDLNQKQSLWDIGFCTGSVSIEAKLQFPHLHITAFEVREEGRRLMQQNSRKFGVPGVACVIGDFLQQDLSLYPPPNAVFIGGHGGRLEEMLQRLRSVMQPDCCIVLNAVREESRERFEAGIQAIGMQLVSTTQLTVDAHNPIYVLKAIPLDSNKVGTKQNAPH